MKKFQVLLAQRCDKLCGLRTFVSAIALAWRVLADTGSDTLHFLFRKRRGGAFFVVLLQGCQDCIFRGTMSPHRTSQAGQRSVSLPLWDLLVVFFTRLSDLLLCQQR